MTEVIFCHNVSGLSHSAQIPKIGHMGKITEHELKAIVQEGGAVELQAVDEGMTLMLTAAGQALHTKRGTRRSMTAQTGLKFAHELGLSEVVVKLPKKGRKK